MPDARRISRAHEMFDEIAAFTFGHELAHHYWGHTGCANGQASGFGPALEQLGRIVTNLGTVFNQPNEIAADSAGCIMIDIAEGVAEVGGRLGGLGLRVDVTDPAAVDAASPRSCAPMAASIS